MRKVGIAAVLLALMLSSPAAEAALRHVIVIALENKDAEKASASSRGFIYGNDKDAPYLNRQLAPRAARAVNFIDELPDYFSQPHYIAMEAGTNRFADTAFTCDNDPGETCRPVFGTPNWTQSPDHLVTLLEAAGHSWMTYQEDIDPATTGACPVRSAGLYAAKHNPFVYFADVAGSPPAADNANCIAHTRDLARFGEDMKAGRLADYVFISPNLCHDMHGAAACKGNAVAGGDRFLAGFLPPLLDWAAAHDGVVFLVWDEGKRGLTLPFYAAGAGVKAGHESAVRYSHRSLVKTIARIFRLPELAAVNGADDLADLFEPAVLP